MNKIFGGREAGNCNIYAFAISPDFPNQTVYMSVRIPGPIKGNSPAEGNQIPMPCVPVNKREYRLSVSKG